MQFAPYVISLMLLHGGRYLIRENEKSNFSLAIFGYTIVELIALDWIGISPNPLGIAATIMFGCCAIAALWISHANSFSLKKLSFKEVLMSVLIGALESLLLYWMQRN